MLFSLWNMLLLPSSTMVSSFLFYILGTESLSFFVPTLFLLLCLFFHTLYTIPLLSPLFASSSLQFYTFWYRLHHMFLTCLLRRNPCSQFLWIWSPLPLYPLQSTYVATTSSVNYPLSSRSVPSGGMLLFSQYSYAFSHVGYTSLLSYCTFCGLATHATSFLLLLSFSATMFGHSHL